MSFDAVGQLLEERIGLDVASVGTQLIQSAVAKRLTALQLTDPSAYAEKLRGNEEEITALIEEVIIPESWFFRDGRPFLRLQEFARTFWKPPGRVNAVMRILSLPCAGGEEAYSIAIALCDQGVAPERFRVDAVDVSKRNLELAERGFFRRNSFRGSVLEQYGRYFCERPDGWELDTSIRGSVHFAQGNLLDGRLLRGHAPYDIIFCRNLLIYLTDSARQHALDTLNRLLSPHGMLFVGHAETIALLQPRFVPDPDRGSFAYVRAPATVALPAPMTAAALKPATTAAPPAIGARREAVAAPRRASLDHAAHLADQKQYDQAQELCEQVLREQGPSARAYTLLGMIHLAIGAAEKAEEQLLKAVYLNHEAEEALLALAHICERRGNKAAAGRYRARAQRARPVSG